MPSTYVHIVGEGRVYQGAAIVTGVVFQPDQSGAHVTLFDGLDNVAGEKVFEIITSTVTTQNIVMSDGVRFPRGIYVNVSNSAVETTVFFQPLEL